MVGQKVVDFTAPGTGGEFRLSAQKGHPVILYFYPKDNTPGCTVEGTQFRDLHKQFAKLGAVVLGVSRDSLKSHHNFKTKMPFPSDLLSHPPDALCRTPGPITMTNMYD